MHHISLMPHLDTTTSEYRICEPKPELLSPQHFANRGCVAIDDQRFCICQSPKNWWVCGMKKSASGASYRQCFVCRRWTWDVCRPSVGTVGADLCLPCYVDVLEVRQARGVMSVEGGGNDPSLSQDRLGNSPSPFPQLDLFDS